MDFKETISVLGNSGKHSKMTYETLLKKKYIGQLEVYGKIYYIRITEWFRLDKEYKNLEEATRDLVKFTQKLYKLKSEESDDPSDTESVS